MNGTIAVLVGHGSLFQSSLRNAKGDNTDCKISAKHVVVFISKSGGGIGRIPQRIHHKSTTEQLADNSTTIQQHNWQQNQQGKSTGGVMEKMCKDCVCWCKVSAQDGGIGICDNRKSDHDQHVIGHAHMACNHIITEKDAEDWEWQQAPAWKGRD